MRINIKFTKANRWTNIDRLKKHYSQKNWKSNNRQQLKNKERKEYLNNHLYRRVTVKLAWLLKTLLGTLGWATLNHNNNPSIKLLKLNKCLKIRSKRVLGQRHLVLFNWLKSLVYPNSPQPLTRCSNKCFRKLTKFLNSNYNRKKLNLIVHRH